MDRFIPDDSRAATIHEPGAATQRPVVAFASGSLEFYGKVRNVEGDSIAVSMPDGKILTLDVIPGQTDLSHNNHDMPVVGQMIKAHAVARHDGSFTATEIARAGRGDRHDRAEAEYRGVTTSVVGSDMVLHFQVGMMAFSFPISATADLRDFDDRAQSIGADEHVEVVVEFQGAHGTIVEVERKSAF